MCISIYIFKIKDCSLVTDVDCSELHVVMEAVRAFLTNKGQFERYTVQNLQKFASFHELFKQFLLENYSEIRKYCIVPALFENNHSLIRLCPGDYANTVIVRTFPRKPLGLTSYGLHLSYDNVFSIECINQTILRKAWLNKKVAGERNRPFVSLDT